MSVLRGMTVGAGHFAAIQMEAWACVQGVEIAGIADLDGRKARELAERYGIPRASVDFGQMAEEIRPDFIDICTPPDTHLHYAKLAADLGLPVLCQKPMAPSQEESRRLADYCAARGVPLMINENWRWQAWYREIKAILESGALGRLFHVDFTMRPGDGWGEAPYPLQPYFARMQPFLLLETGVHWVDTFRFLFGEITRVYCQLRRWNPVIRGEDAGVVLFDFASGMTGLYDANRVSYAEEVRPPAYGWMSLEGEQGNLRLERDGRIYLTLRGEREREHRYTAPPGWNGGSAVRAQQHFVDCLRSGKAFETSGTEYLQTQKIVFACYESARIGQAVAIGNE